MKILLLSGHYYPHVFGGTEKVVQCLAEELVRRDHTVIVVTLTPNRSTEFDIINGVRVHYLPIANTYFPGRPRTKNVGRKLLWHVIDNYNPVMASAFGRVLASEQPDVVNTHNIGGFSAAIWRIVHSRRIPLVHTAHGLNLLCPWYMTRDGKACQSLCGRCCAYAWMKVKLSNKVGVFTAVSRYVVETYSQYMAFLNSDKLVIYNSVKMPADTAPVTAKDRVLRFGFLGRLHSSKGVQNLVRSFNQLAPGSAELLIAGSGASEYESELKRMVNGRNSVRWLGVVKPEALLRNVDILVVPSLVHDSAPLVVLESMSYGVPVIGARRGGIPELMGEGTGYLFDPEQPSALTETMNRVLQAHEEFRAMGKRASRRALDFSLERMISGYLNAYSVALRRIAPNV